VRPDLFITEDTTNRVGMDVWVAVPSATTRLAAARTVRSASLTDCTAEPSRIYFDKTGTVLFAHALHREGDDLSVAIAPVRHD
jgi:hypothetical protein